MQLPTLRRRWIKVAVVLVLVVAAVRLLDSASWIYYYGVDDGPDTRRWNGRS
jgi:hypothetical protein